MVSLRVLVVTLDLVEFLKIGSLRFGRCLRDVKGFIIG